MRESRLSGSVEGVMSDHDSYSDSSSSGFLGCAVIVPYLPSPLSALKCITGEDKVARSFRVTGEAGFHQTVVAKRAVFVEVTEAPAARRGVLLGVLDHKLNVRGRPGNERLGAAKDAVVFLRRRVTKVQRGNDCTVRERKLSLPVSLDCRIVTYNGTETVEASFFVGHGDHCPVAISGGHFSNEHRSGFTIGTPGWRCDEADNACRGCNSSQQENYPFHEISPCAPV